MTSAPRSNWRCEGRKIDGQDERDATSKSEGERKKESEKGIERVREEKNRWTRAKQGERSKGRAYIHIWLVFVG